MKITQNRQGQGLTEYLILLVLIALTSLAVSRTLGSRIKGQISKASTKIGNLDDHLDDKTDF